MIRPNVQLSLANARSYFREHLCVGDYYSEQNHVGGEWFGKGAVRLGLSGKVRALPFLAMCDGNHPRSGERLTQRKNSVRSVAGRLQANRRVFFDFVLSPPKSVSIVGLMRDSRITSLHADAVRLAMAELEAFAETRVRTLGSNATRRTGNLVVAMFQHDTSRELDPQIHTHCVTFNATHDATEDRWKALDVSEMYRAQKFAEACYQHELARGLRKLGYRLVETPHNFEIRGISESLIQLFSKRHRQIDAEAKRVLESGARVENEFELRERIARDKRRRKMKDATAEQLRPQWEVQLNAAQRAMLATVRSGVSEHGTENRPDMLLAWADHDVFERNAVARDYQVLTAALLRGRGGEFELDQLKQAMARRSYVRHEGSDAISLHDQLLIEQRLVAAARRDLGARRPLGAAGGLPASLTDEQRGALAALMASRDFVTVFRGRAGTGKSFLIRQAVARLSAANSVVVLAPQNQQVQELHRDGLKAQTLASLLANRTLPFGAVVVLDEAGQVSARQLYQLVGLVEARGGRLLLCGDTRQHGAVEASDGLSLLEQKAGLKPIELTTIMRQDPGRATTRRERAQIRSYRDAVKLASEERAAESFDLLERQGWIRDVFSCEKLPGAADAYCEARARGESVVAVSQTRAEVAALNEAIRGRLASSGILGEARRIQTIQDAGCTVAMRQNPAAYAKHRTIVFLRSYGRFKKGDTADVLAATESAVSVEARGRISKIALSKTGRFALADSVETEVSIGERLQLRFNGRSKDGHRISNGELVTVLAHESDGGLKVRDDRGQTKSLSANQRQFSLGYAVTSYGSQGKTVDTVVFCDSGELAATNRKQWYVTISRGRKQVQVFTDDAEMLRAALRRSGERGFASDALPKSRSNLQPFLDAARLYYFSRRRRAVRVMRAAIQPGLRLRP